MALKAAKRLEIIESATAVANRAVSLTGKGANGLRQLGLFGGRGVGVESPLDSVAARRAYLDTKFSRTGNLDLDISRRGYLEGLRQFYFPIEIDSKIFYSGPANNLKADIYSQKTGKLTIDRLPVGVWLKNQALYRIFDGLDQRIADEIWKAASTQYAVSARGQVYVFANGANPTRIFNTIELPILRANPLVTNINYLDHPCLGFNHSPSPGLGY